MPRRRAYDYDQRDFGPRGYSSGRGDFSGRAGFSGGRRSEYDRDIRRFGGRDPGRPRSYDRDYAPNRSGRPAYGGDYWWIGEHEFQGRGRPGPYDAAYRRFSDEHHPRFSPVGGMYPTMGGRYADGPPRPLRDYGHFSDWTRWF